MRGGGEDGDGMGGLRLCLNIQKGGGRGLPKLNKSEQEGGGDPNIGPCVIT